MQPTIFVQIASYRDPQLVPTLNDLIDKAKAPENLSVVVCWQHGDEETFEQFLEAGFDILGFEDGTASEHQILNLEKNGAKIRAIDVPYHQSKGACWARNLIQQYYSDEMYTLQLDSHHRFVEAWDEVCIDMLESLRDQSKKPLLTAYIPSFDPDNDPAGRVSTPWKMDFDRFIPEGAVFFLPSTMDDWKSMTKPLRARFYSAHFCFADGSFAVEVQHDPEYFFHGEEISIAARAFTHGYDLYHPHKLIAWHEYTRKGRTKIWDDHTTPEKKLGKVEKDWVERNNHCHRRNRILFGMDGEDPAQIEFGKYGFGPERTLRQYEEYAGLSFKLRAVQQQVVNKLPPEWPVPVSYATEQEWEDSMTASHDLHICFHKSQLMERDENGAELGILDDYDFMYVAAHDAEGEIFRKDLNGNEIRDYIKKDWFDYRMIFLANRKPTHYVVWPHSKSKEWRSRLEFPVPVVA